MLRCSLVVLFVLVGLTSCSLIYGQSLDFRVEGPTEIGAGEYVELRVAFPAGVKADCDFTPVEEDDFGVHPIVSESVVDGKLVPTITGRACTFSARCLGERDLTVVATVFASVDGVPRVKSIKHKIRVKAVAGPTPPPKQPPTDPPQEPDDDLGPRVPLPSATLPKSDVEKIAAILDNVVTRIEALEKRTTQVSATGKQVLQVPSVARPAPAIVDPKPGHWTVADADLPRNPTKAEVIAHLRQPQHDRYNKAPVTWKPSLFEPFESRTLEELLTIHDLHHENARPPGLALAPKPAAPAKAVAPVANFGSACPGGVCPVNQSSYTTGPLGVIRWRR